MELANKMEKSIRIGKMEYTFSTTTTDAMLEKIQLLIDENLASLSSNLMNEQRSFTVIFDFQVMPRSYLEPRKRALH